MISNDPIQVNEYFNKLVANIKGMLTMDEKEIKAYREGFIAGADIKGNFKFHILGYDVAELLTILGEHKLKQKPEEKPAFEVKDFPNNTHYKIYANGRIEGFPNGGVVINRIPELMELTQPERSIIDELYQSNVSLTPYGLKCRLEEYGYKIIKDTELIAVDRANLPFK